MRRLQQMGIERIAVDFAASTHYSFESMHRIVRYPNWLIFNFRRVDGFLSICSTSTVLTTLVFLWLYLAKDLGLISSFFYLFVALLIKFGLQKALKHEVNAQLRVMQEPLYRRAVLIKSASRAFNSHFDYYDTWYISVTHGAKVDEAEADRYCAFMQKAYRAILQAEANFNLARSRIRIDGMKDNRAFLIELMGILNQPSNDPIAELTDNRAGRILDEEDALVEVINVLQSLRLDA